MHNHSNSNNRGRTTRYVSAGKFNFSAKSNDDKAVIEDSEFDYKNVSFLKTFLTAGSRLLSKRATRLSSKQQRKMKRQIKLAQFLALLPYCDRHE